MEGEKEEEEEEKEEEEEAIEAGAEEAEAGVGGSNGGRSRPAYSHCAEVDEDTEAAMLEAVAEAVADIVELGYLVRFMLLVDQTSASVFVSRPATARRSKSPGSSRYRSRHHTTPSSNTSQRALTVASPA